MTEDSLVLSEAIVVWAGWGETRWPARDEGRLVRRYGAEGAAELLPRIRELKDDFYVSDARFTVADLRQMGDVAAEQFRKAHPEVGEDAVKALAWCYTYDFK